MSLTLVFNAGSSSLKYQVFDRESSIHQGHISGIGHEGRYAFHHEAFEALLSDLGNTPFKSDDFEFVGHRVVHGGEQFQESVEVTDEVFHQLSALSHLAPLHNPPALEVIKASNMHFPHAKQIAVFDTAFHAAFDEATYTYALHRDISRKFGIRKYGFHGISHQYVSQQSAVELGIPLEKLNLITCHLGAGSSITAIQNGTSIDNSMGFTPLAGLMMMTRSGDIDPGVILYLLQQGYQPEDVYDLLNFQSGLVGIAGTGDMREIKMRANTDKDAKLAREMYIKRVLHYIGSYFGLVPHLHAIVLTGGIGENDEELRMEVEKRLQHLGVGREIPILVIQTNEELAIARECWKVGDQ